MTSVFDCLQVEGYSERISSCCTICSVTKQPPFCLDFFREIKGKGPVIWSQWWVQPPGTIWMTEVTMSCASMLISCSDTCKAAVSYDTQRPRSVFDENMLHITAIDYLCMTGFECSFKMMLTDTAQMWCHSIYRSAVKLGIKCFTVIFIVWL